MKMTCSPVGPREAMAWNGAEITNGDIKQKRSIPLISKDLNLWITANRDTVREVAYQ
jgi:hypothetical protein